MPRRCNGVRLVHPMINTFAEEFEMSGEAASPRISIPALTQRLAAGWQADHPPLVDEFIRNWRRAVASDADDLLEVQENTAHFRCSIDSLRLKNFSDVHCLL